MWPGSQQNLAERLYIHSLDDPEAFLAAFNSKQILSKRGVPDSVTALNTLTVSPMFWALKITFRIALTHSSRLGMESADNATVFWLVRKRKSLSPVGSQEIA